MAERWFPAWGFAAVAFGGASLLVPLYVVELGGDALALGLLFASSSLVGVPGALVCGNLADRTGRRRVFVLAAMVLTTLAMAVIPFFSHLGLVIVANAMLWLGFAAAVPVLTLLVVTDEPPARWSSLIARLNKIQGLGWATGLGVGFLVVAGGTRVLSTVTAQRAFFVVCALSAAVGLVLARRTLPPDPPPAAEPARNRLFRASRAAGRFNVRGAGFPFTPSRFDPRQLRPRRLVDRFSVPLGAYFLVVFLFFTGFGTFFAPLPAYLDYVGYTTGEIFAAYFVLNVGAAAFYGVAAALIARVGLFRAHAGGLTVRAVALPTVTFVGLFLVGWMTFVGVLGVMLLIGLTWAVIVVTAGTIVSTLTPPVVRGEALGMYGALGAIGGGIGGLLGGRIAVGSFATSFLVAAGLVLVAAIGVAILATRARLSVST